MPFLQSLLSLASIKICVNIKYPLDWNLTARTCLLLTHEGKRGQRMFERRERALGGEGFAVALASSRSYKDKHTFTIAYFIK